MRIFRVACLVITVLMGSGVLRAENGPAVSSLAASSAPHKRPPNILFILADDVGVETLGCYGGTSYPTPHIDALARSGLRFQHCYSMPVCHPTRITLLTGKYPFRLKHPRWGTFPREEEKTTVAQRLKRLGYATAIAGKWQLVLQKKDPLHPQRLGFDQSCLFGWHEGPRYYDPLIYQNGTIRTDTNGKYGPDLYVAFLADFMRQNKDRPFFAYYSMALCHDVTDDLKEPVPFVPGKNRYETYAEMMHQMDRHVGQIVAAVDRLGLSRNTIILFTGDNGTSASHIHTARKGKYVRTPVYSEWHGKKVRGGKGSLRDGGTHVPLLVRWSGVIPAGTVTEDLVDMSDFLPTFVELAGGKLPAGESLDGQSFARRLRGEGPAPRRWAYAEGRGRYWLRTQRWKLYHDGRLFDLHKDPQEKRPVPPGEQFPAAAKARLQLQQALRALRG